MAMSLARQVELMEPDRQALAPTRPGPCGLLPNPVPAAPPPPLALPAPPVGVPTGRDAGNQRRLTPEEQVERRRLWLCFNCDEKYSRGHNRFCRRIFFVDGVELDDTDDAAAGLTARHLASPYRPWRTPCRSRWCLGIHHSSHSSIPAARKTSSLTRRCGALACRYAGGPVSRPWSPMASRSPARV
jgi:hypothetical protein